MWDWESRGESRLCCFLIVGLYVAPDLAESQLLKIGNDVVMGWINGLMYVKILRKLESKLRE